VTDHFAKLGVPRVPWLDAEMLKERFHALSTGAHPDKATNEKQKAEEEFRGLNESYQVLRHSRSRILHLLELQGVAKPEHVQAIPTIALDLFSSIADVTRHSDALLKEKTSANSPMLKVQFFEKALPCVDSIQALQNDVQKRLQALEAELQTLNGDQIEKLQQMAAALGFLEKWQAQLQERATILTF
jgi:DnaJ-domain-containing protein 1